MKPDKIPGPAASRADKSGSSHPDKYGKEVTIGVKIATAIPKDGRNALPCSRSRLVLNYKTHKNNILPRQGKETSSMVQPR